MGKFHKNEQYFSNIDWTAEKVKEEINTGLKLLNSINKRIVAIFGSHKVSAGNEYYKHCKNTAYELGKSGYAIISGGGPGIMHAANSGATEAGTISVGLKAELLTEEKINEPIFTHEMSFHFLFVRRFIMSIKSEALIFYPGGYGTLNELFEFTVLMQTGIIDKVPIIYVEKDYWKNLFEWLRNSTEQKNLINKLKDFELLRLADTTEKIISVIES